MCPLSSSTLSYVIEQNNLAVQYLEQGESSSSRTAIQPLSNALRVCRTSLTNSLIMSSTAASATRTIGATTLIDTLILASLERCLIDRYSKGNQEDPSTGKIEEELTDEQQYIHRRPICLPSQLAALSWKEANVLVSTVLTFNLGLAFQLCAKENILHLPKAAKLYELSFSLVQEGTPGCALGASGHIAALLVLAIINNLGLVHGQMNQNTSADRCFEYVLSTLMFATASGNDYSTTIRLDGFFRNATRVMSVTRSAPAA